MTDTALREALHEVASAGVGPVADARLAVMADLARGGEAPSVSGGGGRRGWVIGALAVAAVVVLVVVGVAQALRPVEVTPASGPGSLPDQIFPSREHILSLEQAPIGRVSMVYATTTLSGEAAPAWIAVGADTDEYRWVGQRQYPSTCSNCGAGNLDVSGDGTLVALGLESRDYQTFAVQLTSAQTGEVAVVQLETAEDLGGEILGLRLSPSGDRLAVLAAVVVERLDPGAHRWEQRLFVIDRPFSGSLAETSTVPIDDLFDTFLVGWTADEAPVLFHNLKGERSGARLYVPTGVGTTVVGRADTDSEGVSPFALSPDGSSLALLRDPTPTGSGDGAAWSLQVFDTRTGEQLGQNSPVPEDSSVVIGWRDGITPLLYTAAAGKGRDAPPTIQVAEYPSGAAEPVRVVDLGSAGEESSVSGVALAADILESGEVRDAQPPDQPWYDPRTLGPAVRDWVSGHTAFVVLSVVFIVGIVAAGVTRLSRRRRAARSRSSA